MISTRGTRCLVTSISANRLRSAMRVTLMPCTASWLRAALTEGAWIIPRMFEPSTVSAS